MTITLPVLFTIIAFAFMLGMLTTFIMVVKAFARIKK